LSSGPASTCREPRAVWPTSAGCAPSASRRRSPSSCERPVGPRSVCSRFFSRFGSSAGLGTRRLRSAEPLARPDLHRAVRCAVEHRFAGAARHGRTPRSGNRGEFRGSQRWDGSATALDARAGEAVFRRPGGFARRDERRGTSDRAALLERDAARPGISRGGGGIATGELSTAGAGNGRFPRGLR